MSVTLSLILIGQHSQDFQFIYHKNKENRKDFMKLILGK